QSLQKGIDTSDTVGYSFTYVFKHLSEFQSDVISEQTKKGMVKAKEKGESVGRPRKPDENVQRAIDMYQSKNYSLAEIRKETEINKSTIYRYLKSYYYIYITKKPVNPKRGKSAFKLSFSNSHDLGDVGKRLATTI